MAFSATSLAAGAGLPLHGDRPMVIINNLRSVSALLLGIALMMVGSGALSTLLGLRMAVSGAPSWQVGMVMTMYFAGIVIGATYAQKLIAAVGHIRAFAAFGSLVSAAALAHALHYDPWYWAGLRMLFGFCAVGMFMCSESWLAERSDNTTRGQIFALYQVAIYLSQGAGQFLINIPDSSGFLILAITSVLMSLAIVPVAVTRVQAPPLPKPVRFRFVKLWETSPTGMTTAFASGLMLGAIYGLGPLFAQRVGLETSQVANFMGAVIIGGLVLQWPIGRISDSIDRRTVMLGVALATAFTCLALLGKGVQHGNGLLALAALFGGLSFTLYPLAVAYTNDYLEADDLVPASGGLIMAYGLGAAVGPAAASWAMDGLGPDGLFQFCGAVAGLTAAFIALRMSQRDAPAMADQGDFTAMPRTTQVIYEIDPRCEDEPEDAGAAEPAADGAGDGNRTHV